MPDPDSRYVFVYGTLRRGGRNDINRLAPPPRFIGPGAVAGTLYHMDWYPGLTLGGATPVEVQGEIYQITRELEAELDRIEEVRPTPDSEYFKRVVPIEVQGRPVHCLLYEVNPERVRGLQPLGHGDWLAFHKG